MMCDDCIYSKDRTCILENAMFDIDDNCISKIEKETYAKIYNKAIDEFSERLKQKNEVFDISNRMIDELA